MTSRLTLLVRLAGRNLLASPINLLIGGLLFSGTIVFVVVGGLLDSVNQSMARSVIGSIGGHVQIYSAKSRDELAPFGQLGGDLEKAVHDLLDARALAPENVAALEVLENQGAPQVTDASLVFLRYPGTNLDAFPQSFIADPVYEEQLKLEGAGRPDKTKDALALGRMIATDDELERYVKENRTPTRESILQLDALLPLYRMRLNDTLTIKAFTKSGSMHNVNVPVYGTFAFTGLEKSPLAGNTSLMDIMRFRDLYGYLTSDQEAELAEIRQATGAKTITREDAKRELFGEDAGNIVSEATPCHIDVDRKLTGTGRTLRQEDLMRRVYTQDEIDSGVVLDAADLLKDPRSLDATIDEINRLAETEHLGIPAVSWQKASGLLGQVIGVFRALLFAGEAVIFFIALVVINDAMMMATIQRTQTIGTMRATGAQRSLVQSMVLVESVVSGLVFGGLGLLGGTAIIAAIASTGIPAPDDTMYFFFSGSRLVPTVTLAPLVVAPVLFVTTVSTLFPALLATRISPLRAMQADD